MACCTTTTTNNCNTCQRGNGNGLLLISISLVNNDNIFHKLVKFLDGGGNII